MKHRLFFVLAALGLLCACRDAVRTEGTAQEGVSLDSLWKRCVDLRVGAEGSRVDVSDCVRGVPMPILVDSTPFAAADYSFVRVNAVTGYELCRYGEHALLEIEQGGCEYFGVTFRWSYNAVGEEVSDRQLVRRALLDTRQAGRYCGPMGEDVVRGADTLLAVWSAGGDVPGEEMDFRLSAGDFYYKVRLDSLVRFSDAAVVALRYVWGPLGPGGVAQADGGGQKQRAPARGFPAGRTVERARGVYSSARYFSASRAALQPDPAEVMAWR